MREIIRLLRVQQWIKNTFIYLPIFFGGKLLVPEYWGFSLIAFLSFSLGASSIYCLNDIYDVKQDRMHPTKSRRPIAKGSVGEKAAAFIALLLGIGAVTIWYFFLPPSGVLVIIIYLALNVLYTIGLKHIPILDICIIAIGFDLRVVAGGVSTGIPLSTWIIIMVFLLTLMLALSKRRDDVVLFMSEGIQLRESSKGYNLGFIDQCLGILASVTIVCYIIYTISPTTVAQFGSEYVYLTTIFVVGGILRYLQLTIVSNASANPTSVLLHDRAIQICILLWVLSFIFIIYCS